MKQVIMDRSKYIELKDMPTNCLILAASKKGGKVVGAVMQQDPMVSVYHIFDRTGATRSPGYGSSAELVAGMFDEYDFFVAE